MKSNILCYSVGKNNKKGALKKPLPSLQYICYFSLRSSDTVSLFLPFALRAERTLLPLAVDILDLKPCLFALFLLDG
jgi:hypothetical protein